MTNDVSIDNPFAVSKAAGAPRWLWLLGGYAVLFLVIAALWEGSKALFAIPDYKLPHLAQIAEAFARPTPKGPVWLVLLQDAGYTALEALVGFTLGSVTGFAIAVLFQRYVPLRNGFLPYVIASQPVPIIAIAPMIVVGMGALGAPPWLSKSIIAAYLTFFPVVINVLRGLESVDRDALLLMRPYAATDNQIFRLLRLPASVPYLFTALQI